MKLSLLIIPAAIFLGGVAVGNATEPDPVVQTRNVEVIKRVDVPGPIKTVTKEVVKTRNVTPQSCKDAITQARMMAGVVAEFAETASEYPPLVPKAFQAGMDNSEYAAASIINEMQDLNARLNAHVVSVADPVAAFNDAAAGCK